MISCAYVPRNTLDMNVTSESVHHHIEMYMYVAECTVYLPILFWLSSVPLCNRRMHRYKDAYLYIYVVLSVWFHSPAHHT